MRRVGAARVEILPMVVFALGHDVFGVGEGGDPAAVDQPRVPADMVPVQMRAHDEVDLFRLYPEPAEVVDERALHAVELRPRRAFLVVADARIDEDRMTPRAHHEAVKAEDQLPGPRLAEAL